MAIQKKLIHFKKLESFQEQLDSNNILDTSIVFIQDAKLIWTHGQYYGSIDEIQTQLDDLIDEVEKNELVTAAGLVDLEDKKADKSTTLSGYGIEDAKIEDGTITLGENTITPLTEIPNAGEVEISEAFTETVYPEGDDPDIVFTSTKVGDSIETSVGNIESTISNLITATLDNEKVVAASLTDLEERKAEKADLENYLTTDAANGSIISISENYPVIDEYADGGKLKLTPVSENSTLDEAIFTLDNNISDISKIILDNELVTASSLTDLEERKANKEDFETFSNETESKILELSEEVSENEEVTAAALVDLDSRKAEKSDLDNYLLLENANGANIILSDSYVPSEYPENTGDAEFQAVESNETMDSAISKLDKNVSTLVQTILDIEEVTAASYTELNDKKLDAELFSDHYSEDPQLEYKKLGGNNVYEKFFSLTYTTPGTEAIWELPCTEENSIVTVLGMNCILQQVLDGEGTISFDYRDQYLFGDNANILKYYYKHSSGSLIIKFTSNKTTTLTGLIKFSSSNVVAAGDSSTVSDEEVLDGGTSA